MKTILVEIFNKENNIQTPIYTESFNVEENQSFENIFKSAYKKYNNHLFLEDLDTDKILLIKWNNITIKGEFMRSFSSFWYYIDIENIDTKQKETVSFNKDNCYFCPKTIISKKKLEQIINVVNKIS